MAASASTSFTAGPSFAGVDGLLETEKNSEEPENTYILRPIFQQRRVADGMWRGDFGSVGFCMRNSSGRLSARKERAAGAAGRGRRAGGGPLDFGRCDSALAPGGSKGPKLPCCLRPPTACPGGVVDPEKPSAYGKEG